MNCLYINGIRGYGYVGFFAEEKKLGQWFQVDLKLEADLQAAAESDDLSQTIDYAHVVNLTQTMISTARVDLIETLAASILDQLLLLEKIQTAQIRLTKESPPIPDFSGSVTVEMTRSASDSGGSRLSIQMT